MENGLEIEIGEISFYLSKDSPKFLDCIKSDKAKSLNADSKTFEFQLDDAVCQFIYFEKTSTKVNPKWLDFVNQKIEPESSRIVFSSTSKNPNGIIFIKIKGKVFAATFGKSAASYINLKNFEPDFGIKTAMNMCGNQEIRQTKSRSHSITTTHIDRQVSSPSDTLAFGMKESEILRYISAHLERDRKITLQGKENLTLKVLGKEKFSWEKLVNYCEEFLEFYQSDDYKSLFPNYLNFIRADEKQIEKLDEILVGEINKKSKEKLQLAIPEFIQEDKYSFSYSAHDKKENCIYSYLHIEQVFELFVKPTIDIKTLRNRNVYAYSHEESKVLGYKYWQLYDCLVFEAKLGKDTFILSEGNWLKVEEDFYDAIENFIENEITEVSVDKSMHNIDISDKAKKQNLESIFNSEIVKLKKESRILFDKSKLKIGLGKKDKEFCDILEIPDGSGNINIINVKKNSDAASINYLFTQSKFYTESFLSDQTFLDEIRDHIGKSPCSKKTDFLNYIKSKISDNNGKDYNVSLWILYDKKELKAPSKNDIPLIAKYELKLMYEYMKNILKINSITLSYIPVIQVQFTTSKKP